MPDREGGKLRYSFGKFRFYCVGNTNHLRREGMRLEYSITLAAI